MATGSSLNTVQLLIYSYREILNNLPAWKSTLNVQETERASRLKTQRLQDEFTSGRGLLRNILADKAGIKPSKIEFEYTSLMKPSLKNNPGLHFNVSHSKAYWAVALSEHGAIGMDIEFKNPTLDFRSLAQTFCTPFELAYITAVKGKARRNRFFQIWSGKESVIKMDGRGLSMPVRQLQLLPESETSYGRIRLNSLGDTGIAHPEEIEIETFNYDPDYSLAVCCSGNFETKIHFNKEVKVRVL